MSKDPTKARMVNFALEHPKTPYEIEMTEAISHFDGHLYATYNKAMSECGLNETMAKSAGVLISIQRLLVSHLCQHAANLMLPKEKLAGEIECILRNINGMVEETYDEVLAQAMIDISAAETKQ